MMSHMEVAPDAIPPITDPMGKNWEQPDRSRILIDSTHALMSLGDFNRLCEYSATNPSGVYVGKMWKRHDGIFDREFLRCGGKPRWLLCWYGPDPMPGYCSNNYREILLIDGTLPGQREKAA